MAKDDRYLVEQTLSGSRDAFAALVQKYHGVVYGFAVYLVGRYGEAEDCAQEAFIEAYKNLGRLRDPDRFVAWLRGITYRTCMDWLRKEQKRVGSLASDPSRVSLEDIADTVPTPPSFGADPCRKETSDTVMRAVRRLPEQYQLPVVLRHLQELSYEEIAGFMGVTVGTVRGALYRANQLLRNELRPLLRKEF